MPTGAADRPHPLPHDRPQHTAMRGAWRAVRLRHGFRDDGAVEEVDPAGGARDIARIVGGDADRRAAGVQLFEHLHHGFAAGRVEVAGGLVGEHDGRTAGDGARDRDELLVAAREGARAGLGPWREPHARERRVDARRPIRPVHAVQRQRVLDVLVHRHIADQVEALEDEAHIDVAHARFLARGELIHAAPVEPVASAGRRVEQAENREHRGLTAAGRARDRDVFAAIDVDRDVVERARVRLVAGRVTLEQLGDPVEPDERHVRIDGRHIVARRGRAAFPPGHHPSPLYLIFDAHPRPNVGRFSRSWVSAGALSRVYRRDKLRFPPIERRQKGSLMTPRRFLPALLLLFVGSGCAALIYEVIWFQLLQLVIGSSAVSMGVLLGTFMGGMCLGSYLLPRFVGRHLHPLRVYAFLELGIGAFGLLILFGMPLLNGLYVTVSGGSGVTGILFRGLAAAICLLPPTLLMGATLPAISRWVESTPEGVSWLGFFYGGNIGGGVLGSLAAGFYLLRLYDLGVATYVAVALNLVVAGLAIAIAKATPVPERLDSDRDVEAPAPVAGAWAVYVAIALSGATALSSEVIWTRLLSLLFGGTVYTFALILAVFLFGLGLGSSLGSAIGRAAARPRVVFGWCQMFLCAAIAWSAYMLTESMPYWPINPSITTDPLFNVQLDFVRCLWVVLPGAILWGASFPLALASLASRGQDPARLVGGVYAANTVGAIVGSVCASLLLVVWLGSQHAQQLLIVVSALSGLLVVSTL